MRREIHIFFTALMFYTRIPCPSWVDHREDYINKATRYFPLIGWIVGGISALVLIGASFLWNIYISVLLSMIASVWITGAFHEDGFADVCDGIGGGWTKERILTIMKDSRLGTFGTAGLIFILLIKFFLLLEIIQTISNYYLFIVAFIISGHSLSRFIAVTFIFTHPYARDDESSKTKPVAKSPGLKNLWLAAVFMILPLLGLHFVLKSAWVWVLILPVYLSKMYLAGIFQRKIGGYTGDCLGATQQVSEIVFYLSLIAIWKFI